MIPVRDVVPAALTDVIRKAPLTPEKVTFAWRMAVGPVIDKSTSATLDADGVLHIKSETPAWLDAVRKSSGLIRSRLDALLGTDAIKHMQFEPLNRRTR